MTDNIEDPKDDHQDENPRIIIVAPNSNNTTHKQSERMYSIIKKIVEEMHERMPGSSFSVDAVDATKSDVGLSCDHVFVKNDNDVVSCPFCESKFPIVNGGDKIAD